VFYECDIGRNTSGNSRKELSRAIISPHLDFSWANETLVFPDTACIVFRACNDCIALVVKGARENFVFMALARVGSKALNF
jgi:hypothetical protein